MASVAEERAELQVKAWREEGAKVGLEWAKEQPAPLSRGEICDIADARYPGNGADFLRAYNVSDGFIEAAEAHFKSL